MVERIVRTPEQNIPPYKEVSGSKVQVSDKKLFYCDEAVVEQNCFIMELWPSLSHYAQYPIMAKCREMNPRCLGLIISKELGKVTVTFAAVCSSDDSGEQGQHYWHHTGAMPSNPKWLNETLELVPVTETKNYKY